MKASVHKNPREEKKKLVCMTKRRRNMQMYGPAFKVFEFDEV